MFSKRLIHPLWGSFRAESSHLPSGGIINSGSIINKTDFWQSLSLLSSLNVILTEKRCFSLFRKDFQWLCSRTCIVCINYSPLA